MTLDFKPFFSQHCSFSQEITRAKNESHSARSAWWIRTYVYVWQKV